MKKIYTFLFVCTVGLPINLFAGNSISDMFVERDNKSPNALPQQTRMNIKMQSAYLSWTNNRSKITPAGNTKDIQPVLINPGEAVLVTFLEENLYKPQDWHIHDGSAIGLTMQKEYRMFHGAMFQWLRPPVKGAAFCMEKEFDVSVGIYDNLIVGAAIPDNSQLVVSVKTEKGVKEQIFNKLPDQHREYTIPLNGAQKLKHLTLSVYSKEKGVQAGAILWIILQNEKKLSEYEQSLLPFGKEWKQHIQPEEYEPEFTPTYGIVFSKKQLNEIRARHESLIQRDGHSAYLDAAKKLMQSNPEDLIKEYLGNSIRFGRDRDLNMPDLKPSELAIAGILTKNKEMLRMAARYAMTLAVTPYWDEGFMGHFPGSNWVHAAFRESWAAHELAITLDLAGEMFTQAGKNFILKRLAIDGIGHINYITWSAEYIHRMNQMSVFSHGRILAYAILEKTMPRVKPYLELAYKDLVNSLQTIILPDGGDVEGPGYMTYTIAEAGLALYYYAMATGKSLAEVIPPNILNTEGFAEALYSTVPENDFISICDTEATIDRMDAVAFLAAMSDNSRWGDIYRKALSRKEADSIIPKKQSPGLLALVIPSRLQTNSPEVKPFVSLPDMGIMASTRKVDNQWLKILIQGNKAKAGHTHEDKGSFIIEFAGEVFAGDYGRAPYGDAMTFAAKQCQWHNMLIPMVEGERPGPANPIPVDVKPSGNGDTQHFEAQIDATPGWEKYYAKNLRNWYSPTPEKLFITDEYELIKGKGVEFYWQTMLSVHRKGNTIFIEGKRGKAEIRIPQGTSCRIEPYKWWNGKTINRIIFTRKGKSGKIETCVHFKVNKQE